MKQKFLTFVLLMASALFFLPSCGGQKKVTEGAVEINIPFSTSEYQSNKDFIRVRNQGVSLDQSTAKEIAMMNCREEIAADVQAVIKAVSEKYTNQVTIADKMEYASKFEKKALQCVNVVLNNTRVIGERLYRAKDGRYTYHIAMEMSAAPVKEEISKAITSDEKLSLEFDKFRFDQTFDEEMAKFEAR